MILSSKDKAKLIRDYNVITGDSYQCVCVTQLVTRQWYGLGWDENVCIGLEMNEKKG